MTTTAPGDPYSETLLDLYARQQALCAALERADQHTSPGRRAAALDELHTHLRGMAAVVNDALGGWPNPVPGEQ